MDEPLANFVMGVEVGKEGTSITIMQMHPNGTITVVYSQLHPPGESIGKFNAVQDLE